MASEISDGLEYHTCGLFVLRLAAAKALPLGCTVVTPSSKQSYGYVSGSISSAPQDSSGKVGISRPECRQKAVQSLVSTVSQQPWAIDSKSRRYAVSK